jgi:hypothetical protein
VGTASETADGVTVAELLGAAPCDACRYRSRCAVTGEACNAFRAYLRGESEARWRLQPTQPRLDIGRQLGIDPPELSDQPDERRSSPGIYLG